MGAATPLNKHENKKGVKNVRVSTGKIETEYITSDSAEREKRTVENMIKPTEWGREKQREVMDV